MSEASPDECPNVAEFTERVALPLTDTVHAMTNGAKHPRIGFVLVAVSLDEKAAPMELSLLHNAPDHKSAYMLLEHVLSEYMASQNLPSIMLLSRMAEGAKICHQILDGILSGKVVKIETKQEGNPAPESPAPEQSNG